MVNVNQLIKKKTQRFQKHILEIGNGWEKSVKKIVFNFFLEISSRCLVIHFDMLTSYKKDSFFLKQHKITGPKFFSINFKFCFWCLNIYFSISFSPFHSLFKTCIKNIHFQRVEHFMGVSNGVGINVVNLHVCYCLMLWISVLTVLNNNLKLCNVRVFAVIWRIVFTTVFLKPVLVYSKMITFEKIFRWTFFFV